MSGPSSPDLEALFLRCRDMNAPLAEQLKTFAKEARSTDLRFSAAIDALIERLTRNGAGSTAPKPGDRMPRFLLPDQSGTLVGLEDLLAEGPVAISFHRGHWCPYCRISISALARASKALKADRGQIVAITPDRQKFNAWLKADAKAPFPILTDVDNAYALSLNLAIWVGDELKESMEKTGWDPALSQGTQNWMLPIPATFVVGTDGVIVARFVDPNYRVRMAIENLVSALRKAR